MKRRITFQTSRKIKLNKKNTYTEGNRISKEKKIPPCTFILFNLTGERGLFVGENILLIYFFFDFLLSLFESFLLLTSVIYEIRFVKKVNLRFC